MPQAAATLSPAEDRARRVISDLQALPPPERAQYFQSLMEKGELTPEVTQTAAGLLRMATPVAPRNNPGNIKAPSGQFLEFDDPEKGWAHLRSDLQAKIEGRTKWGLHSESTIMDLARVWAPATENKPEDWARNVSNFLNVPITEKIGKFQANVQPLAEAVSYAEGTFPSLRPAAKRLDLSLMQSPVNAGETPAPPAEPRSFGQELLRRTINPRGEKVEFSEGMIPFSTLAPEPKPGEGAFVAGLKGTATEGLKLLEDLTSPGNLLGLVTLGGAAGLVGKVAATRPALQAATRMARYGLDLVFGGMGLERAGANVKKGYELYKKQDYEGAAKELGGMLPDAALTALSVLDAAHLAKMPKTQALQEFEQRVRREFIDEYAAIRDLEKLSPGLPVGQKPSTHAQVYAGHLAEIAQKVKELRPILQPVAKARQVGNLSDLLLQESLIEVGTNVGPRYKMPGGVSLADVQQENAALRARLGGNLPVVESATSGLRAWSDTLLQRAADSGLISQNSLSSIRTARQKYAPLYRLAYVADELENMPVGSKSFSVATQNVVNRIGIYNKTGKLVSAGSEKEVLDPLQGFIRNGYRIIGLAARNEVGLSVANLSAHPDFTGVIRPLGRVIPGQRRRAVPTLLAGESKFSVFRDGIKEEYSAPTAVVDAMKSMNRSEIDLATQMASWGNRFLKAGATTYYLPFIANNVWRDFWSAKIRSEVGFTPIDWLKGFATAVRKDQEFEQYIRSGAGFAGLFERSKGIPQDLKRLTEGPIRHAIREYNPVELMRKAAETVELAPRIGVFQRAIKAGNTTLEAAYMARNATVDFWKAGSTMKKWNLWIPFLNARVQGISNILTAFRDRPASSLATVATWFGVPATATYIWNTTRYPKVWDNISDFEKNNYINIIYGDGMDAEKRNYTQVAKIPKGDVGRYFLNPVENFLDYVRGHSGIRAVREIMTQVASDVSPIEFARRGKVDPGLIAGSVLPPMIKTPIEIQQNRNLRTGIPVVYPPQLAAAKPTEQLQGLPKPTPEWVIATARTFDHVSLLRWLGLSSPLKLTHAIQGLTGGVGRLATMPLEPEKNEWWARTGAERVARMYTQASAGGVAEERLERREPMAEQEATSSVITKRTAQNMYFEISRLRPSERPDYFVKQIVSGRLNEETFNAMKGVVDRFGGQPDAWERIVESDPVALRARELVEELRRADPEERAVLFGRWMKLGILTEGVAEKAAEQLLREKVGATPAPPVR